MLRRSKAIVFVMAFSFVSCGSKPPLEQRGSELQTISIAYLKSLYLGAPYTIREEVGIEGWIVANDEYGNFYKTLVVQDETGGIEIKLDMENIFLEYWRDEKVRVNCNSLTVGEYGGVVQLGVRSADPRYETDYIPNNRVRSTVTTLDGMEREIVPVTIGLELLADGGSGAEKYVGCYVRIDDVQFADGELGLTWSDPEMDANRLLVDRNGNRLNVRTGRYAAFAGELLPLGSGTIRGLLSYFNGEYQLKIIDPRSVEMKGERF